jgi:hypothetical protein
VAKGPTKGINPTASLTRGHRHGSWAERRRGGFSTQPGKSATAPMTVGCPVGTGKPRRSVFVPLAAPFPAPNCNPAMASRWSFGRNPPGKFRRAGLVQMLPRQESARRGGGPLARSFSMEALATERRRVHSPGASSAHWIRGWEAGRQTMADGGIAKSEERPVQVRAGEAATVDFSK